MRPSLSGDVAKDSTLKRNKDAVERVLRSNDSSDEDNLQPNTKKTITANTPRMISEQTPKTAADSILRRRQVMFDSDDEDPPPRSLKAQEDPSKLEGAGSSPRTAKLDQKDSLSGTKNSRISSTPKHSKLAKLLGEDGDDESDFSIASQVLAKHVPEMKPEVAQTGNDTRKLLTDSKSVEKAQKPKEESDSHSKRVDGSSRSQTLAELRKSQETIRSKQLVPTLAKKPEPQRSDPRPDVDTVTPKTKQQEDAVGSVLPQENGTVSQVDKQSNLIENHSSKSHQDSLISQNGTVPKGRDSVAQQDLDNSRTKPSENPSTLQDVVKLDLTKLDTTARSKSNQNKSSKMNEPVRSPNPDLGRNVVLNPARESTRSKTIEHVSGQTNEFNAKPTKPPLSGRNSAKTDDGQSISRKATPDSKSQDRGSFAKPQSRKEVKYSDSDSDDLDEIAGRRARAAILSSSPVTSRGTPTSRAPRASNSVFTKPGETYSSEDVAMLMEQIATLQLEVRSLKKQLSTQADVSERQIETLEKALAKARDDEKYYKETIDELDGQLRCLGSNPRLAHPVASEQRTSGRQSGSLMLSADVVLDHGERIKPLNAQIDRVWDEDMKRSEPEVSYRRVNLVDQNSAEINTHVPAKSNAPQPEKALGHEIWRQSEALSTSTPIKVVNEFSTRSQPNPKDSAESRDEKRGTPRQELVSSNDVLQSHNPAGHLTTPREQDGHRADRPKVEVQPNKAEASKDVPKSSEAPKLEGRIDPIPLAVGVKDLGNTGDVEISLGPVRQINSPSTQSNAMNPGAYTQNSDLNSFPATPENNGNRLTAVNADYSRNSVGLNSSSGRPVSARTPTRKSVLKTVPVVRQPLLSSQSSTTEKIGIGISFGVTAKGDVFITGMAAQGPAQMCGQIKRGDQLLAVDGVTIRGWDVNDIVKSIVGPCGSVVTLDIASYPELRTPEPSPSR